MPNHLQYETSPYPLQHAENPVDWYPWSTEAFRRAREKGYPLKDGKTTFYVCRGRTCLPPVNEWKG